MRKCVAVALIVFFGCIVFLSAANAEMAFNYGASERVRQEIWDNIVDLKTLPPTNTAYDRNFFRFRTSLWGSADYNKDIGVYLKFTSEFFYNLGPYNQPIKQNLDEGEGVIDNIYIKANNIMGLPVDLKIGRQDFLGQDMYGEGFLIMDGTPGDGSRTFYFNAAKAKWRINQNHSVDFVYITNQQTDGYLPTWRTAVPSTGTYFNNKKILNAGDEQAFVIYGRNKLSENLTVEPYYIYKQEGQRTLGPATPELDLNTIGARAVYQIAPWKVGGEFAHQFGEYDGGRDRSAYGGYLFGSRKYADMKLKPEVELRFVYLSGDNPDTKKDENWDPLFSRNPYWNELLIYTQIYEFVKEGYAIPGYWSNMQLYMAKVNMELTPDTKLSLAYQYLRSNETAQSTKPAMFGNGHERGHLPTALITHKISKNIDAMFQYEYFVPGSFYAKDAKCGQFLRWQLMFKI